MVTLFLNNLKHLFDFSVLQFLPTSGDTNADIDGMQ